MLQLSWCYVGQLIFYEFDYWFAAIKAAVLTFFSISGMPMAAGLGSVLFISFLLRIRR
ncbi:hypothetical protein [Corynebacterium sp. LK2510]|uniref:hypothetical protein n=1 Tax=Corynebacterium sp. LK2510 TaxID=3110472 RepID=UPI0034CEA7B8